jgi:hypothetical protein
MHTSVEFECLRDWILAAQFRRVGAQQPSRLLYTLIVSSHPSANIVSTKASTKLLHSEALLVTEMVPPIDSILGMGHEARKLLALMYKPPPMSVRLAKDNEVSACVAVDGRQQRGASVS